MSITIPGAVAVARVSSLILSATGQPGQVLTEAWLSPAGLPERPGLGGRPSGPGRGAPWVRFDPGGQRLRGPGRGALVHRDRRVAHDLTPSVRSRLGIGGVAPSESTIRRALQTLDPGVLDQAMSAWLQTCAPAPADRQVIAVDGKTARGARRSDSRAVHLLAALDQHTGAALAQCAVDAKTNEINTFAPLLDRIDITGAIITADALHTQRAHVTYLTGRGAHYIFTAKGNQPGLHHQLLSLPWTHVPPADTTTSKGHGRLETRTVKLAAVPAGIGFPQAALAIQITRTRRPFTRKRASRETVYAITDLTYHDITAAQLADAIRGHWSIENRLHWIRDVTFAEDHSQIRTGHGPQVVATLRNPAVSLHRLRGATNIAAACRRISRHPNRVLPLIR